MFSKAADTDAAVHSFRLAVFHGRFFLIQMSEKLRMTFFRKKQRRFD